MKRTNGTPCPGLHLLGAVRGHAVLPTRPRPFAAGDLRGLRSSEGKLKHLGITAPSRSTLAYANEHRPWQLYRAVFEALLAPLPERLAGPAEVPLQEQAGQPGLDGDRPMRHALRLGEVPAHQGSGQAPLPAGPRRYLPAWSSSPRGSGTTCGWPGPCPRPRDDPGHGPRVRGLRLVQPMTIAGVFFVTRLKDNALYRVVERRELPSEARASGTSSSAQRGGRPRPGARTTCAGWRSTTRRRTRPWSS